MTFHRTDTGHIELLDSWGHGKPAQDDWIQHDDVLIADDGDGHYDAWRFTGAKLDAAKTIAPFLLRNDDRYVVELEGSYVRAVDTPSDFWIEQPSGDFLPNPAHSDVIAY